MEQLAGALPLWLWRVASLSLAVILAIILHRLIVVAARRFLGAPKVEDIVVQRLREPLRWLLVAIALSVAQPALELSDTGMLAWGRVAGLAVPALFGWLLIAAIGLAGDLIKARLDIGATNNLAARRKQTRIDILHRLATFVVLLAAFCFMLMSIPSVRSMGVTLIASAGLAALAVGAAAQPALKNLVAGLQMAFTEPIRIDDVVIVEGEWGRIEEIRLTYVVVKLWDERRLIVPVAKFLDDSFQNWTLQSSALTGSVYWYLDPATDVGRLRARLLELVRAHPNWDGRACNMQVTDTRPEAIEVRALMTAKDASATFDLRCDIREALLLFIREEMPSAMVRYRGAVDFKEGGMAG